MAYISKIHDTPSKGTFKGGMTEMAAARAYGYEEVTMPDPGTVHVAENLRRVARRLRGEEVDGLENLDPSDPATVAALLEHEAAHLEKVFQRERPSPPPNWRGREIRFEDDSGQDRSGVIISRDERNSAYLVVGSGGAKYRVHGCMVRHILTKEESARVKEDWLAWTGGHPPSECPPEDVDRYVELAMPTGLPPDAVEAALFAWGEEDRG